MIGETIFQATARFENGEPSIKVTAFTGYGKRTVSVAEIVNDTKLLAKLASVFESAVENVRQELQQKAVGEAARSLMVATDKKETI